MSCFLWVVWIWNIRVNFSDSFRLQLSWELRLQFRFFVRCFTSRNYLKTEGPPGVGGGGGWGGLCFFIWPLSYDFTCTAPESSACVVSNMVNSLLCCFWQDWSSTDSLMATSRASRLQRLQPLVELREFLTFMADEGVWSKICVIIWSWDESEAILLGWM